MPIVPRVPTAALGESPRGHRRGGVVRPRARRRHARSPGDYGDRTSRSAAGPPCTPSPPPSRPSPRAAPSGKLRPLRSDVATLEAPTRARRAEGLAPAVVASRARTSPFCSISARIGYRDQRGAQRESISVRRTPSTTRTSVSRPTPSPPWSSVTSATPLDLEQRHADQSDVRPASEP